jgi:hypothetical protein
VADKSSPRLSIEYLPTNSLKPCGRNARTHSKYQIRQIADSVREFGFTNPVLVDRNNRIIAGHGRVEAAKLLGLDHVPTIRLDTLIPDQLRAYVIADNRLAIGGGRARLDADVDDCARLPSCGPRAVRKSKAEALRICSQFHAAS